jgi:hypothetical protein
VKRYPTPLVIRAVQTKATVRDHFLPAEMTSVRGSVGKDVVELEPSCISSGMQNVGPLGKAIEQSHKKINIGTI